MSPVGWGLAGAAGLAIGVVALRASRRAALDSLRASWGQTRPRLHKMDAIEASHRMRADATGPATSLDDRTWADLNLDQVFEAVDRTESTVGQHALYHRLRTTPAAAHLDAFESLVGRMTEHAATRERAQLALASLRDPQGYPLWWLERPDAVRAPAWYVIFPVLALIILTLLAVLPFEPRLMPFVLGSLGVNLAVHFATLRQIGAKTGAFRQLAPVIATGQALRFLTGDDIDPLVRPLHDDLRTLKRLKTISRWSSGNPFMLSAGQSPLAGIVSDLANTAYEYVNFVLPVDAVGLYFGAADLARHGRGLVRVVAAIGDIDTAISVASLRAERSTWTRPRFLPPGAPAVLRDACHPLVPDVVPNSISLAPGCGVLVTGSNMSGKSTFLRTVGVSAVLAQTIHTCFAAEYAAPVFRVRSSIGRADDLVGGKSYYLVEVEALLSLVAASADTAPHLFLLDELFRGTNAVERIAAGASVLLELVGGRRGGNRHVVLAATHDTELVEMLADSYSPCHFGDSFSDEGLTFDHRLKPGRSTSRNAIALLRLHGAPPALIDRALASAEALDRTRIY